MSSVIYRAAAVPVRARPIPARARARAIDPVLLEQFWGFHGSGVALWQAVLGSAALIGTALLAGLL